jgi:hypothetical protein
LNGKWVFLLKAVLLTTPAAWAIFVTVDLPWRVWVTRASFSSQRHEGESADAMQKLCDQLAATQRDLHTLEVQFLAGPTETWKTRILALEQNQRETYEQNQQDHLKIMLSLEAIRVRLDIPSPQPPDGAGFLKPRGSPDANTATNQSADHRDDPALPEPDRVAGGR